MDTPRDPCLWSCYMAPTQRPRDEGTPKMRSKDKILDHVKSRLVGRAWNRVSREIAGPVDRLLHDGIKDRIMNRVWGTIMTNASERVRREVQR